MPQILIEIIFILFLAGSAVWTYISRSTKTVIDGVKDKIKAHEENKTVSNNIMSSPNSINPKSDNTSMLKKNGFYIFKHIDPIDQFWIIYIFGEKYVAMEYKLAPLSARDKDEIMNTYRTIKNDEYIFDTLNVYNIVKYHQQGNIVSFTLNPPTGDIFSFKGTINVNNINVDSSLKHPNGRIEYDRGIRLTFFYELPLS